MHDPDTSEKLSPQELAAIEVALAGLTFDDDAQAVDVAAPTQDPVSLSVEQKPKPELSDAAIQAALAGLSMGRDGCDERDCADTVPPNITQQPVPAAVPIVPGLRNEVAALRASVNASKDALKAYRKEHEAEVDRLIDEAWNARIEAAKAEGFYWHGGIRDAVYSRTAPGVDKRLAERRPHVPPEWNDREANRLTRRALWNRADRAKSKPDQEARFAEGKRRVLVRILAEGDNLRRWIKTNKGSRLAERLTGRVAEIVRARLYISAADAMGMRDCLVSRLQADFDEKPARFKARPTRDSARRLRALITLAYEVGAFDDRKENERDIEPAQAAEHTGRTRCVPRGAGRPAARHAKGDEAREAATNEAPEADVAQSILGTSGRDRSACEGNRVRSVASVKRSKEQELWDQLKLAA